jgi:hypothetical protein
MFYKTIDGFQQKVNEKEDWFQVYKEVSLSVWGAVPLDVTWAMETPIFKERFLKMYGGD